MGWMGCLLDQGETRTRKDVGGGRRRWGHACTFTLIHSYIHTPPQHLLLIDRLISPPWTTG